MRVYEERLGIVRGHMAELGIEEIVLFDPANVMYLTGHWTILSSISPQALVVEHDYATLIIPSLESAAADHLGHSWLSINGYRAYPLQIGSNLEPMRSFQEALGLVIREKGGLIAADLDAAKYAAISLLRLRGSETIIDFGPVIRKVRAEKDALEVAAIREAARIVGEAVMRARQSIHEGITETAIAGRIAECVWDRGATVTHIVVGAGSRSALAHPEPTSKRVAHGELVLIDVGVLFEGYWAEVARTVVIGSPSLDQRSWHETVLKAQGEAARLLTPGQHAEMVDAAARGVISTQGFDGAHFNHATGHGLGVLGMDLPLIAPQSTDQLPHSCALTLEPALYFKDVGGIRIEDTYLIADGRVEVLTDHVVSDLTL